MPEQAVLNGTNLSSLGSLGNVSILKRERPQKDCFIYLLAAPIRWPSCLVMFSCLRHETLAKVEEGLRLSRMTRRSTSALFGVHLGKQRCTLMTPGDMPAASNCQI